MKRLLARARSFLHDRTLLRSESVALADAIQLISKLTAKLEEEREWHERSLRVISKAREFVDSGRTDDTALRLSIRAFDRLVSNQRRP